MKKRKKKKKKDAINQRHLRVFSHKLFLKSERKTCINQNISSRQCNNIRNIATVQKVMNHYRPTKHLYNFNIIIGFDQ